MKHIKMPKELATKWLAALRSGEYAQGRGFLYEKEQERFCCLGVLEHCADGSVEDTGIPSFDWLKKHEIIFLDEDGESYKNPYLNSWDLYASEVNDAGTSFEEIAKELEGEIEFTDEDAEKYNKQRKYLETFLQTRGVLHDPADPSVGIMTDTWFTNTEDLIALLDGYHTNHL